MVNVGIDFGESDYLLTSSDHWLTTKWILSMASSCDEGVVVIVLVVEEVAPGTHRNWRHRNYLEARVKNVLLLIHPSVNSRRVTPNLECTTTLPSSNVSLYLRIWVDYSLMRYTRTCTAVELSISNLDSHTCNDGCKCCITCSLTLN